MNKNNYKGVIIEESLESNLILEKIKIIETKIELVTKEHKTPWIKQWTLHTIEIIEDKVDEIVKKLSFALDSEHNWYADFKNDFFHYIIFRNRVFKIDRSKKEEYIKATNY